MIKKLLLFLFIISNYFAFAAGSTQQNSYRWRLDDGNETNATWKGATNAATLPNTTDQPLRLRIAVLNTSSSYSISFNSNPLQYRKNNGAWVNITSSTANDFYFINSAFVTNNTATTQQISTGSFIGGFFKSDNSINSINLTNPSSTELEYCIARSSNYDIHGMYEFQISGLNSYIQYPKLDPICSTPVPTVSNISYIVNQTATPLTATGTDLLWYTNASGGIGSTNAPTPETNTVGSNSYWVSQTLNGCEGPRTKIDVVITSGQTASCLNFDGVNDRVELPNESNFDFTETFTLEAWIKVDSFTEEWQTVISKGTQGPRIHRYQTSNLIAFGTGGDNDLPSVVSVNDGNWHHISAVCENGVKRLYVDGVFQNTHTVGTPLATNDDNVRIGSQSNFYNPIRAFKGNIDDVRIWSIAKTEAEINNSMNCELTGAEFGLVAYYKFNQGVDGQDNSSETILIDETGNNSGTITNFSLNGVSSNFISGGSPLAPISFNQNFCGPATINDLQVSGINGGTFNWYDSSTSGSPLNPSTSLATGTYYVTKINGSCESARFSIQVAVNPIPSIPTVSTPVVYEQGGLASALSATTGTNGTGLMWYTTATGGTGSTTAPTPSTATAGSTSYWVSSTNANGCESERIEIVVTVSLPATHLNFDGVNDNVSLPATAINNLTQGTIEVWVYPTASILENQTICAKQSNNENTYAYLSIGGGGKVNYQSTNGSAIQSISTIISNQWTHIAVAFTSTQAKIYINGILDKTVSGSFSLPNDTTVTATTIGAILGDGNGQYFTGSIDEFRIWNIARTAEQIAGSMNCELQGTETGLVSYYQFNQGIDQANNAGVTTLNATIGSNGTLTNFTLTGTTSNWLAGSPVTTG